MSLADTPANAPLSILIIDDSAEDRLAIRWTFKKSTESINLTEASNEAEALQAIDTGRFDCILLDYRLGGTDGLELLKKLTVNDLTQTPIIMLSGLHNESLMLQCLQQGAQDFLLKSELSSPSLLRSIRHAAERKKINEKMRHIAHYDSLTGLASRGYFLSRLQQAIDANERNNSFFALFFIDLDNFKTINDQLGHDAGDQYLMAAANNIASIARSNDIVGRLGGDEFAVLMEDINAQSDAIQIVQRLINTTKTPVTIGGQSTCITLSVGIATYPSCASDAETLLKCADIAMYHAKEKGKNGYQFYAEDMQLQSQGYSQLVADMQQALEKDQFEVYYQPQICSRSRQIVGLEALLRWPHPERGMIAPDDFIPVAERGGLITAIGEWVIRRVFRQYREFYLEQHPALPQPALAINISTNQLRDDKLLALVSEVAKAEQMPLAMLELELSEQAVVRDTDHCALQLTPFVDLNIRFAIDDFGTDHSSVRQLQSLPVQTLKIDNSFVAKLEEDANSLTAVKAIIAMGQALKLRVIAEGVETEGQAALLTELGCDLLQGYYFSPPVPLDQLPYSSTPLNSAATPVQRSCY